MRWGSMPKYPNQVCLSAYLGASFSVPETGASAVEMPFQGHYNLRIQP